MFFYDEFQSQRVLQEHLSLRLYKILQEHYHYVCLNIAGKFILTSVKIFQELYPYELQKILQERLSLRAVKILQERLSVRAVHPRKELPGDHQMPESKRKEKWKSC